MRKFREIFRKFSKYGLVGGSGAEPSEVAKILKKLVQKSMETGKISKNVHEFLTNFDLKRLILIKIKATLLEF